MTVSKQKVVSLVALCLLILQIRTGKWIQSDHHYDKYRKTNRPKCMFCIVYFLLVTVILSRTCLGAGYESHVFVLAMDFVTVGYGYFMRLHANYVSFTKFSFC